MLIKKIWEMVLALPSVSPEKKAHYKRVTQGWRDPDWARIQRPMILATMKLDEYQHGKALGEIRLNVSFMVDYVTDEMERLCWGMEE